MPRKVSYGPDFEDGYDDDPYDDYDEYDDYDYDIKEEAAHSSQQDKEHNKQGVWSCSICTYDNDEAQLSCEICGVLRESSGNVMDDDRGKAHSMSRNFGVSVMAKSLFAQNTNGNLKKASAFDDILCKEANKPSEEGRTRARIEDLQELFVTPRHNSSVKIGQSKRNGCDAKNWLGFLVQSAYSSTYVDTLTAPFHFDTPSPDDIVSTGKNSTAIKKKGLLSSTTTFPSMNGSKGVAKCQSNSQISNAKLSKGSAKGNKASDIDHKSKSKGSTRDNGSASQNLANKLDDLKIEKTLTNCNKIQSLAQSKPEKSMLTDEEQGTHTQLNLAIVGHVDSGKSTISGRLLQLLGRVSKKDMHKFEKEAKEKGKGSFAYAWTMDESTEERERGITMTVAVAYFDTRNYRVVLLDSPGHKDFVPNMISGARQADAAVLVVDASVGSFEAGMGVSGVGQTREHAQLIRSFGVEQLIVAVNKMDRVDFSKERFDYIKMQLSSFLRSCGFKESSVIWVPLSAMENQNLVKAATDSHLSSWYQGPCLFDAIDSLQPPVRDISQPLILPICDVVKSHSLGQVAASGKLETGTVQIGSKVLVMPAGEFATVKTIERGSQVCSSAKAGDNVAIGLQGIDGGHVFPGGVLCHPDFPVHVASRLELRILILDIKTPILVGSQVEFHIHHAKESARVAKILSLIDSKTGKTSNKVPRVLMAKQSALIEVDIDIPVCVEEFTNSRALGRAFLRASGNTIAVGVVSKVLDQD